MSEEYSDRESDAIFAKVRGWTEQFSQSDHFERLSEAQKGETYAVTEFFAQYAYSHLGLTPETWDRSGVVECCLEILPRKVSAEPAFFEAVAPVLSGFFNFLGEQSLLRKGQVLAEVVAALNQDIVLNSQDVGNWGPAKSFVMLALAAGVDVTDERALQAFILETNQRLLTKRNLSNRPEFAPPLAPRPLQTSGQRPEPKVEAYAPCPCGSGKKYKFCCRR